MKLLIFIFLINSVLSYKYLRPLRDHENFQLVKVFKDVINELYLRPNIPFDLVTFGKYTPQAEKLFQSIRSSMDNFPMKIKHFEKVAFVKNNYSLVFNQSAIIIGKNIPLKNFNFHSRLQNDFPKEFIFLIYSYDIPQVNPNKSLTEFSIKNNKIQLYEYFLYDNSIKIDFITFEWFTADVCNKAKMLVINSFVWKSKKWKEPFGKIEKKFRNFYGCKIVVMQTHGHMKNQISGALENPVYDILDVVGSKANFTVYRQDGVEPFNGKVKLTVNNNLKLRPQVLCNLHFYKNSSFHVTTSFEDVKYSMVITKGEKYGSYEKLFKPFDITTWSLLLLTFSIAFIVIFIVNQTSKRIQNLLYGESIHFPILNVFGTFFGISQSRVPTSNFPRMVLMCFILFCLVIRTAYQGVFFEMMAGDIRKYVPTTIDGLLEENYTIFAIENHPGFEIFNRTIGKGHEIAYKFVNLKDVSCSLVEEALNKKAAFILDGFEIKVLPFLCTKDFSKLDAPFMSYPVALILQRNHFMYHVINEVVDQTIPAGIPQHWFNVYLENWYKNLSDYKNELKSLKLDDWRFGFDIWLAYLGFSFLVFIIEVLQWPKVKKAWSRKWKIKDERKRKKRAKKRLKTKKIQVKPKSF
ncbi:hypothetical protein PVAND_003298 [Polypedilum vanderplanki]|uniref:Ionotropic receptor n=1 Tax=Polypedilum vanderplanki TaxID=319348 RepID=A0A9J6BU33_POLVA|nr:hypothetical protein PVAND_003298 [Polypedilum vanderplanki]